MTHRLKAFILAEVMLMFVLPLYAQQSLNGKLYSPTGVNPVLATPVDSPGAGTYGAAQTISFTVSTGQTYCYTVNGNTPTATVPGTCDATVSGETTYSGPFTSPSSAFTLKAIATEYGYMNSAVDSSIYTITANAYVASSCSGDGFSEVTQNCSGLKSIGSTSDVIVLWIYGNGTLSASGCGATWTTDTAVSGYAMAYGTSPSTGPCIPVAHGSSSGSTSVVGLDITNASGGVDVHCTSGSNCGATASLGYVHSGSTITGVQVTPTQANDIVIGCFGDISLNEDTYTAGGSFSFARGYGVQSTSWGLGCESYMDPNTSAIKPTCTSNQTATQIGATIAIK
jgi:hypothetical protein